MAKPMQLTGEEKNRLRVEVYKLFKRGERKRMTIVFWSVIDN